MQSIRLSFQLDRSTRQRRRLCEEGECGGQVLDEAQNCINKCLSPICFLEVYAEELLEDGEIDNERARRFNNCLRAKRVGSSGVPDPADGGASSLAMEGAAAAAAAQADEDKAAEDGPADDGGSDTYAYDA
ncbi:unnamed protein product [Phaeothamnion confervicola]